MFRFSIFCLTFCFAFQASASSPEEIRYKITVDEDGIYVITPELLRSAGAELEQIDPRSFRMTSKGRELPIYVSGESDGRFDGKDYIEFLGKRSDSEYTSKNVYWLSWNGVPGVRMVEEDVSLLEPRGRYETPEQGYRNKARFEIDNGRFQRYAQDGKTVWFWMRLNAPGFSQIPLDLKSVSDSLESGSVRVMFHGSASIKRNMEVFLNAGYKLGDVLWSGQDQNILLEARDVPNYVFNNGQNIIGIYYPPGDSQDKAEQILLDWIEVEYWRDYNADEDYLEFSNPQNQGYGRYQFEVEGFSSPDIQLFKLSSDEKQGISKLTDGYVEGREGRYSITFQDNVVQATRYMAIASERIKTPANIEEDTPSDLRSANQGADYIVVTHRDFYESTTRIAEFRSTQGMRTKVVDVEDVYDEFSYGMFDPSAIRDFIRYAFHNWQKPAPGYVLLLGDASWWYKRDESYVPSYTYNSKVGDPGKEWGPTASDDYFVMVSGNDPLPDLCIGRIPAQTKEEARIAVEKIIEYETSPEPGDWRSSLLFLSGRQPEEPQFIFEEKAEEFINRYVPYGYRVSRIYTNPDSPYFGDTSSLLDAINDGYSFVRFAGHGGGSVWSDDDLLNLEDVSMLRNRGKLPFVVSWTCFTAWFDNPYTNCLAEELLFLKDGGAVALFGSTGLGLLYADFHLEEEMHKALFEKNERVLGKAVMEAKTAFLTRFAGKRDYMDLAATYALIGDPATKLLFPNSGAIMSRPDLVVSASDVSLRGNQDTGYIISVPVRNAGAVDARNVLLTLYDGSPFQTGSSEIGSFLIASVSGGTTNTVDFVLPQQAGSMFYLWVDPLNEISEENESNNLAQLQVRTNMILITDGVVKSEDGILQVRIPEDAVPSGTYLSITKMDGSHFQDTQPDVRYAPLTDMNGAAYEIQLSLDTPIADGELVEHAASLLVEISFLYDPAILEVGDREKLAIYRRLEEVERWDICDDCVVSEGIVSAKVSQGVYALMINSDVTPPELSITLKEQGFIDEDYVSSSPQVSIVAEDANGIKDVKVFLDGVSVPSEELSVSEATGLTPFPVEYHPALRRGEHIVEVRAYDLNGLSSTGSVTITVEPEFRIEDIANRPNPCRTRTLFTYVLTQPADDMSIRIYSTSGRRIKSLEAPASAGYNELFWDLRDDDNRPIANGVYFYKLTAKRDGRRIEEVGKLAVTR